MPPKRTLQHGARSASTQSGLPRKAVTRGIGMVVKNDTKGVKSQSSGLKRKGGAIKQPQLKRLRLMMID